MNLLDEFLKAAHALAEQFGGLAGHVRSLDHRFYHLAEVGQCAGEEPHIDRKGECKYLAEPLHLRRARVRFFDPKGGLRTTEAGPPGTLGASMPR